MTPAEELTRLAAAQRPIRPTGLSLVLVCVTAISLFLSVATVGLRVWVRKPWARNSRLWGWDDTTCVLGLLTYIISCYHATLAALYGLGAPDDSPQPQTSPASLALAARAIQYDLAWEISYLVALALVKTSVGATLLRIAARGSRRRHRAVVWAVLVACDAAHAAGVVFLLLSCRPLAARWNPLLVDGGGGDGDGGSDGGEGGGGGCPGDVMLVPMAYALMGVGAVTDAVFALVPVDIVRGLQMPRRVKGTLMVVLSMGLLAAFFSMARFPFCPYFPPRAGRLHNLAWIPIFSTGEAAVGLVFGSLPAIGSTLRLFGSSNQNERAPGSGSAWLGDRTFGGTSFPSESRSKARLSSIPRGRDQSEARVLWSNSADYELYGYDTRTEEVPLPPTVVLQVEKLDSVSTQG